MFHFSMHINLWSVKSVSKGLNSTVPAILSCSPLYFVSIDFLSTKYYLYTHSNNFNKQLTVTKFY